MTWMCGPVYDGYQYQYQLIRLRLTHPAGLAYLTEEKHFPQNFGQFLKVGRVGLAPVIYAPLRRRSELAVRVFFVASEWSQRLHSQLAPEPPSFHVGSFLGSSAHNPST